jgi:hypothetical protein
MTRRLGISSLLVCVLVAAVEAKNDGQNAFQQIQSIVETLSQISGMSEVHPVAYGRMNKRQLRHFLTKRIRRTLRPEEVHADELALKMFGLVPPSFNLKASTIDLLTEQAAAFYDYDEKKLFLLNGSSFSSDMTTLAHELAHALADQHYDLRKYMDDEQADDDQDLARTAVVEGEASWLMIAYELKQEGQPPEPTHEALQAITNSGEGSMGDYPVLKSSPLYIQQSLLFPYTDGTLFFDAVYRKLGKAAFGAVFADPPHDAAQVMHPNRYFERKQETELRLPELRELKHAAEISNGTVGEFDHQILLWQYIGQESAKILSAHLTGGQFKIVSVEADDHPVLLYKSLWDSEQRADEFFDDYQTVLRKKWKMCDVSLQRDDLLAGKGDNGFFVVQRNGPEVISIEGLPSGRLMESAAEQLESIPQSPASNGLRAQIH